MSDRLSYCIYKNYKGIIFKKHKDNSHLLFLPSDDYFYYFMLLGKDNTSEFYYAALLHRDDKIKMGFFIDEEKELLKNKFLEIESLKGIVKINDKDSWNIDLITPGKHIKSDIEVQFYDEGTVKLQGKRYLIYTLKFEFKEMIKEFPETENKIEKKMFFMKKLSKVKNLLRDYKSDDVKENKS